MNDNVYRIFILSLAKALICMVTAMQTDWTNCSVFSQLLSKVSGSAALAFLVSWPPVSACMLVRIICATADAAWEATLATFSGASSIWVCKSASRRLHNERATYKNQDVKCKQDHHIQELTIMGREGRIQSVCTN